MNGLPEFLRLPHAPITEAVIDFRVKLPDGFDVAKFAELRTRLEGDYPKWEEKKLFQLGFKQEGHKEPVQTFNNLGVHGHFFRSADETQVAQFRRDGFTFSRLKPYTSWDETFREASRLWGIYVETTNPSEVSRIAVRYINRILLPLPVAQLSDYLTVPPLLPDGVPTDVTSFFTRAVIQDADTGIAVIVVQALEQLPDGKHIPLILDIDAYRANLSDEPNEELLSKFEQLRNMKNRFFFGSLTAKSIELFK